MPNGDKLSITDFAKAIKTKYPDYAKIDDHVLAGAVLKKYPEYRDRVITMEPRRGTERAMQMGIGGPPMFVDVPKGEKEKFEKAGQEGYKEGGKAGMEMVGAAAGGEAAAGTKGILGVLLRMLGAGAGGAVGDVVGNVATGQRPTVGEAAKTGVVFGAGQGIGEVASPFMRWLTSSKGAGGKLLQMAEAKAGNVPVELSPETNKIVEQIVEQGKSGGKTPKVISDLLERLGPSERIAAEAKPGPLTYREARNFQGNASSLTVEEETSLKGRTKGLMKQFSKSFGQDVQRTADAVGVGKQHAAGMKEYALASSRNKALTKAGKALPYAAGAAGGYELLQRILRQQH